jgi:hypothetical protein
MGHPMCSISREPRWEEYTICTAVAPGDVFTVRRYGDTRPQYGLPSAQIDHSPATNLQVIDLQPRSNPEWGRSQVSTQVRKATMMYLRAEDTSLVHW